MKRPILLSFLLLILASIFVSGYGAFGANVSGGATGEDETSEVDEVIKVCSAELSMPSEGSDVPQVMPTKIEIRKSKDGALSSITTQTIGGLATGPIPGSVQAYFNQEVRSHELLPGDLSDLEDDGLDDLDLNIAEQMISQAMILVYEPVYNGFFSVGFDLKEVRKATVYVVGKMGSMGGTAVIEAMGEDGRVLGSFLGGFLVAPCE